MHLLTRTRFLLALALIAATGSGCIALSSAEGRFEESALSGRFAAFLRGGHSLETMQLMRLNLVQFDEEGAGTIELFTVTPLGSLEGQPTVVNAQNQPFGYTCTRLDFGLIQDQQLVVQFTDQQSRRWQIQGELLGDALNASLHRVTAAGEVLPNTPEADYLRPEDQHYLQRADEDDIQLVLERTTSDIPPEYLECVDFERAAEFTVELPPLDPETRSRARLGVILTSPVTGTTLEEPLIGLSRKELLSVPLDAIDVLDGSRRVVITMPPPDEMLVNTGVEIALATIVLYEDRPASPGEPGNQLWDNILTAGGDDEPLLGYSAGQVLLYHASGEASEPPLRVSDSQGEPWGEPLVQDRLQAGWSAYGFIAEPHTLPAPDPETIALIRTLRGEPVTRITLQSYDPEDTAAVFPLLFFF